MKKRFKIVDRNLAKAALYMLDSYIEAFSLPIDKVKTRKMFQRWGIEIDASIDEGLEKIQTAKKSLSEALEAIEDVEVRARQNKIEAETAIEQITKLEKDREDAEEELNGIKKISTGNIELIRKIGGFPGPGEVRRERYIGFASGIVASLIATGIIWFISLIF